MSRLSGVYILSLLLLVFLLFWNLHGLLRPAETLGESARETHLELDGDLAFSFAGANTEGRDLEYLYYFYVNGELVNTRTVLVPAGESFSYGSRVSPGEDGTAEVRLVVYREGEQEPYRDITRYLKRPGRG